MAPKFNKKALEGKTLEEFKEIHEKAYPDLDLNAEYVKLFPGGEQKPKLEKKDK